MECYLDIEEMDYSGYTKSTCISLYWIVLVLTIIYVYVINYLII